MACAVPCRAELGANSYSAGSIGGVGPPALEAGSGLADKAERWGSIKRVVAAAGGTMWLSYKRGLLECYSEAGKLLWSSSCGAVAQQKPGQLPGPGSAGGGGVFKPAGRCSVCCCLAGLWRIATMLAA